MAEHQDRIKLDIDGTQAKAVLDELKKIVQETQDAIQSLNKNQGIKINAGTSGLKEFEKHSEN